MKIGNVKLKGKLVLAPMENITDVAFRILCKKQGAALTYTGMVNENAIINNENINSAIISDKEHPVTMQLNGLDPKLLEKAVKKLHKPDIIDLNLGCPSFKILKQGLGAALLKKPEKIKPLIKAMVESTDKPITAKIRAGYDEKNINTIEVAQVIEDAGAKAIAIHPRTVLQGYSGKSDWKIIKEIKENISIPVIGNGDVTSEEKAKQMLEETKCDLVMVGRAAIADPTIFKRTNYYLDKNKKLKLPTTEEKIKLLKQYIKLSKEHNIENLTTIKQRAMTLTKGLKGGAKIRNEMIQAKDINYLLKLFDRL